MWIPRGDRVVGAVGSKARSMQHEDRPCLWSLSLSPALAPAIREDRAVSGRELPLGAGAGAGALKREGGPGRSSRAAVRGEVVAWQWAVLVSGAAGTGLA